MRAPRGKLGGGSSSFHAPRTGRRPVCVHAHSFAVGFPLLFLAGCEPAPAPPPPQTPQPEQQLRKELDNRTEVMHQTREVIRYVDEEQRLKESELRQRGLESPQ